MYCFLRATVWLYLSKGLVADTLERRWSEGAAALVMMTFVLTTLVVLVMMPLWLVSLKKHHSSGLRRTQQSFDFTTSWSWSLSCATIAALDTLKYLLLKHLKNVISGEASCSPIQCGIQGRCKSSYIHVTSSALQQGCAKLCQDWNLGQHRFRYLPKNPDCKAQSWSNVENSVWLPTID